MRTCDINEMAKNCSAAALKETSNGFTVIVSIHYVHGSISAAPSITVLINEQQT